MAPWRQQLTVGCQERELSLAVTPTSFRRPDWTAWDLSRNVLHVWRISLDQEALCLEAYASTLSPEEHNRARRYRFDRDRRDFLVGRGFLRSLLGRYLGVAPERLRFVFGKRGKPALAPSSGAWLRFNISHSGRMLLCALAADRELGVDIECIRFLPDLEEVARCVFSSAERAVLRGLSDPQRQQAFFRCWTRKEAYIKAQGDGFSLPVNEIEVSLAPGEPARLLRGIESPRDTLRWSLRDLAPAPGYMGAVAAEGHGRQMHCWRWEPELRPAVVTSVVEEAV